MAEGYKLAKKRMLKEYLDSFNHDDYNVGDIVIIVNEEDDEEFAIIQDMEYEDDGVTISRLELVDEDGGRSIMYGDEIPYFIADKADEKDVPRSTRLKLKRYVK